MNTQPYTEGGQRQSPASSSNLNPSVTNSLLVADCGTVFTKVSLLGLVEGQYRLMARGEAPTTIAPPHEDITRGIIQAINVIEFITGRHFVSEGRIISPEQPVGDGVDVFIATISAGGPIRLVVLGAVDAAMEGLVGQAASGLYAETHALPSPSFVVASVPNLVTVGARVGTSDRAHSRVATSCCFDRWRGRWARGPCTSSRSLPAAGECGKRIERTTRRWRFCGRGSK
ncbi:MAG: hypothetical protein E6J33_02220 [Chloroflexi bacterium]|nr:MAG: hypothetical protein E6J33_02220 [Chloroflexota bacterium]